MEVYIITGIFIILDVITGLINASYRGTINSTILRKGLYNKLAEIFSVVLSVAVEHAISFIPLEIDFPLAVVVCAYIVVMETVSIIENLCGVNPKLYTFFKPYLAKLKGDKNEQDSSGS